MPSKKESTFARPLRKGLKAALSEDVEAAIASLRKLASKRVRDDMSKRYGIHLPDPSKALGVPVGKIQQVAKQVKRRGRDEEDAAWNHALALALWETAWYEARMLATFVDEAGLVTSAQMDRWCDDFDNWGICDTVCFKLFDQVDPPDHALPLRKVELWAVRKDEFVRRAGFALLACLALHAKTLKDEPFARLLPMIERGAVDDRNFVKKGVSWALRAIGGRGPKLKAEALAVAQRLAESEKAACRWVGKDALKALTKRR